MATASNSQDGSGPVRNKWEQALEQMQSAGTFFRPKEGRTRIRIVPIPLDSDDFYREVHTTFRGREKTRFLITGLVLEGPGQKEEQASHVTPIIIAKTALKGILNYLAEGYDLLTPEGHGISLLRTGSGLDTDYNVTTSKNPVPLPKEMEMGDKTLDQLATAYETWANRPRPQNQGAGDDDVIEDEDEDPAPRRRSSGTASRSTGSTTHSSRRSSRDDY